MAARICIAQVGAPHGVRGEVRLRAFTDHPMALTRYGPLETEDGAQRIVIVSLRAAKDHLVARLDGIDDRDAAQALRNVNLYVARDRLPALEAGEFYHADLVGLAAVTRDGTGLGQVTAVHNFGAGDLIEIRTENDGETLMLPFTEEVVPEVDIVAGRVVIDPPTEIFTPPE